jgi:hypothetical protein
MIEEIETQIEPRHLAPQGHYGETLIYDLAKFLTTLALLATGGVLTLAETAPKGVYRPIFLLLALGAIAFAGVLAFAVAYSLAEVRWRGGEPSRRLPLLIQASTSLLGLGTGGFVWMWWNALT